MQADINDLLKYVTTYNMPRGLPNKQLVPADVSWVPVWATGTNGNGVTHFDMQYDGNLVAAQCRAPA